MLEARAEAGSNLSSPPEREGPGERGTIPIVLFTYYNPLLRYGLDRFAAACADVGVDGVIVVDLPPDEAGPLREALQRHNVYLISLVAPTSTDERLAVACANAEGFVYCVSRTGVTGARQDLAQDLRTFLARVRTHTDLPRAVGFGISRPEHARLVSEMAEGVVIGSALVDLIDRTPNDEREQAVRAFVEDMSKAVSDLKHRDTEAKRATEIH
jgi:tryptophan synthase alpha chain